MPLLPKIPFWVWVQLTPYWQMRWQKDVFLYEVNEELVPIPPTKPPLLEIPEDKKDKIKAFVLGELKEDEEL